MVIGSLCSGYGGLDIGLQSVVGGNIAWHFEYEKAPSKILQHHYPHVPNYGDITQANWETIEPVDWLTAGYPCQPFSTAGQRKGKDDARHLWPYIAHGIRILRPRNILLENVAGHLTLGFGDVLGDLAAMGYDAKWGIVRASDAGAPHSRKRLFIVANTNGDARSEPQRTNRDIRATPAAKQHRPNWEKSRRSAQTVANTNGDGRETGDSESGSTSTGRSGFTWPGFGPYSDAIARWEHTTGRNAPQPIDDAGRLTTQFVEWMMGLDLGHVTNVGLPWTQEMKALGNGVVPQQAALALKMMGYGND